MQKMSEKEAIKTINDAYEDYLALHTTVKFDSAMEVSIQALEELSLYKQGSLVLIPADVYKRQCDELDEYKAIGTVDQCHDAVERMKPKKAVMRYGCIYRCPPDCGGKEFDEYGDVPHCPSCDRVLHSLDDICKCGQRIARE